MVHLVVQKGLKNIDRCIFWANFGIFTALYHQYQSLMFPLINVLLSRLLTNRIIICSGFIFTALSLVQLLSKCRCHVRSDIVKLTIFMSTLFTINLKVGESVIINQLIDLLIYSFIYIFQIEGPVEIVGIIRKPEKVRCSVYSAKV